MLGAEAQLFSAQEKTDKFNALIADAKLQIQVENMPLANNTPYYNGGRKRRTAKKRKAMKSKRKAMKSKRKTTMRKSSKKRKSSNKRSKALNKKTRTH
jgi:hypothetical protein